ncbi:hypothetical protein Csp2054_00620 [Curtobacterium sp. 'Ferrero']|nr:hypothetical protein Csp2054_00620 [Curtobacterium sp. 'Ferrero']
MTSRDGREARHDPPSSASAAVHGRVHGTPAPQYGEYAPEGWVNPVLVEQERLEREAEARALREQTERSRAPMPGSTSGTRPAPDRPAGVRPDARRPAGARAGGRTSGNVVPRSRFGASPLDFGMTVGLLVLGVYSVFEALLVGDVASSMRMLVERQYTSLSDPSVLSGAAAVRAVVLVVAFVLVAWWSVRRLRARRRTFWVPLVGGAVASVLGSVPIVVVVFQDPAIQSYLHRLAAGG